MVAQSWKLALRARRAFPGARLFVWLHCFPGRRARRRMARFLDTADATLLCVSDTHLARVRREVSGQGPRVGDRCRRIYNAVEDHLLPDDTERDPDLLVCLSSPHKGRDEVLRCFAALRERFPAARLAVADPGYWGRETTRAPAGGVRPVGPLARPDVLRLLRRAACLFYPQTSFAETFGLVFAEALAVGTPVLAHPLAAAAEVLPRECWIDGTDPAKVVRRFADWRRDGAPRVSLPERFRLDSVLREWRWLLGEPRRPRRTNPGADSGPIHHKEIPDEPQNPQRPVPA